MFIVSISDNSIMNREKYEYFSTKVILETTDRNEAHRVEKELRAQGYNAWVEFA